MSANVRFALDTLLHAVEHVDDPAARLLLLDAVAQVKGWPSYLEMVR